MRAWGVTCGLLLQAAAAVCSRFAGYMSSTQAIPGELLTPAEAAARLRVSRLTVYRAVAAGTLTAFRVGESNLLRIPAGAIDAHLRRVAPATERGTSVAPPAAGDGAAWRQGQSLGGQP